MKRILIFCLLLFILCTVTASAEEVFFYHVDAVGTPLAMTNATGLKVWEADYKPFGEEYAITTSSEPNDRRFVGKKKDEETGLNYFGARYLSAGTGRFLAPDPVTAVDNKEILLNPQKINLYAYSLNNPYRYMDPDGLEVGDVYLMKKGGAAGFISTGPYVHAAIEISGGRVLSSTLVDGNWESGVYIKSLKDELEGRNYDVYKPIFKVNEKSLDKVALDNVGKRYIGNVCSEVTSRGINGSGKNDIINFNRYISQVSPNDIGSDLLFNMYYNLYKSVEYNNSGDYKHMYSSGKSNLSTSPEY